MDDEELQRFALEQYGLWSLDPFAHWKLLHPNIRAHIKPYDSLFAEPGHRVKMQEKFKAYLER